VRVNAFMETMMILKIVFVGLLSVPILGLSFFFTGKLADVVIKEPGRQR